ncbi:polysaccharide deacetylase family protein [Microbacterium sp. NPDC089318]
MTSLLPRKAKTWLRSHGGPLGSVVSVRTLQPEYVLTYDDGPDVTQTPRLLRVLADESARATFFVLLTRARAHPEVIAEIVEAGHEVALHGPDHRPISRMSFAAVRRRTASAKAELEDMAGTAVRWFRPPYGLQSLSSFHAVKAAGLQPVVWGPTAWDSRPASTHERVERAVSGAERGAILLCHDAYAGFADGGRSNTPPEIDRADLARRVIAAYDEAGLRPQSLGRALVSGVPVRGLWFKR